MVSKNWVTILTISGSIILFGAWLNENYVEKKQNEKLDIIKDYSSKLAFAKIDNIILETRLWNIRNLFVQDTLNNDLKKTLYDNILEYQLANIQISQIANEGYETLNPSDTTTVNQFSSDLDALRISFKAMLDEDSSSAKKIDHDFMNLVAKQFFSSEYSPYLFEGIYNSNHYYDLSLNLAYLYRIWFYIIGSILLAFAYIIQRRDGF